MELLRDTKIDFMKYRKFWIVLSLALVALGLVAVLGHFKLNLGIDFAGGTQITLRFEERPEIDRLRDLMGRAGIPGAQIQRFGGEADNEVMIRTPVAEGAQEESQEGTPEKTQEKTRERVVAALDSAYNADRGSGVDLNRIGTDELAGILVAADPENLNASQDAGAVSSHYAGVAEAVMEVRKETGLLESWEEVAVVAGVSPAALETLRSRTSLGEFSVLAVEDVSSQIGEELRFRGVMAVVLSLLGMLAYIAFRFELRFGIGALMAAVHDVLVCLGIYALAGFEFNLTTIAGFLTVVGYSVNDSVVIFDRVRENMRKNRRVALVETMNHSINQTLSRTLLTSGTTLLAVLTLLFLGGEVIRGFAFVLAIGVIVGTYSSIYIASPFALLWDRFSTARRQRRGAPKPKTV